MSDRSVAEYFGGLHVLSLHPVAAVAAMRGCEAFPEVGGMNLCTGCIQERMYYLLPKAHLLFLTLKTD